MAKIDFDGIKTKLKRDARPMLAGITVGPSVTYRLHGGTTKKKRKSKKRCHHPHSGYLGAWCPWWAPYDTEHGQHDPKFDPPSPTPSPDVSGGEVSGGAVADGGSAAGGVAAGGGMVGESNGVSGEAWGDYDVNDLAVISKTSPMQYARLSCDRLGLTEDQTNDLIGAISEEKSLFLDAISPMGGIALEGSQEADKLRKRGENGLYARGMIWDPSTKEVSGIFVGRGKEEPGCWWDNFAIFTGPATLDGVVIGESADNGLFFESVDEAVGFMVSSKMVEVPPESASDTLKMLRNGVADAISCYTPQLPKRHPFKVFKVCDVPTKEVKQWSYVCEAVDGTDQDKLVDTPAFKRWFGSSKIVDGNGRPMVVWHGTTRTFNTFDKHNGDVCSPLYIDNKKEVPFGMFFTNNYEMAQHFSNGKEPLTCYLRMENPLVVDAHGESWMKPLFKFYDQDGNEMRYDDCFRKGSDRYVRKIVPIHDDLPKEIIDAAQGYELAFPDDFSYDMIPAFVQCTSLAYSYDGVIIKNVLEGNGASNEFDYGAEKPDPDDNINKTFLSTDYIVFDPKQIKEWHNNGKFSRRTANIYEDGKAE